MMGLWKPDNISLKRHSSLNNPGNFRQEIEDVTMRSYTKIFNEFFILDVPKAKLPEYILKKPLDFEIFFSSNSNLSEIDNEKIKFFIPFKEHLQSMEIENNISAIN